MSFGKTVSESVINFAPSDSILFHLFKKTVWFGENISTHTKKVNNKRRIYIRFKLAPERFLKHPSESARYFTPY